MTTVVVFSLGYCVRMVEKGLELAEQGIDASATIAPALIIFGTELGICGLMKMYERKVAADCDRFYEEYITKRQHKINSAQERSFLLGYYAHLIADAEFQRYIRDAERVASAWTRILESPVLPEKALDMPKTWDSIKKLIPGRERMKDIYSIEAEYLDSHPTSGYLTEILPLNTFPDYIDYLPKGAIVRKISVMGYLPKKESGEFPFIAMTREEYATFLNEATGQIIQRISRP